MSYVNSKDPLLGDQVEHTTGRCGRVTEVRPWNKSIGFGELAIKWDNGVASIEYMFAEEFTLVRRAPGKLARIPRRVLADMLRERLGRSEGQAFVRTATGTSRSRADLRDSPIYTDN